MSDTDLRAARGTTMDDARLQQLERRLAALEAKQAVIDTDGASVVQRLAAIATTLDVIIGSVTTVNAGAHSRADTLYAELAAIRMDLDQINEKLTTLLNRE